MLSFDHFIKFAYKRVRKCLNNQTLNSLHNSKMDPDGIILNSNQFFQGNQSCSHELCGACH